MNLKPVFDSEPRVDVAVTNTDIAAEIRLASVSRTIYQPAPEWVPVEYGGKITFFPPDLPGAPLVAHPAEREADGLAKMVPANGIAIVTDKFGPVYNSKTRKVMPSRAIPGESANDFLRFIAASMKYADAGFVWLRGDSLDERRKAAAKKLFHKARRQWAENEVATRSDFVRKFSENPLSKGHVPPPPTADQIMAQEFLDEIRAEGREGAEHICKHGCYESNDFIKYQRHMKVAHAETVQLDDAPETPTVEEPKKNKGGRPPKLKADATA